MAEFYREIIEEPGFSQQFQQIQPDPQLADMILDNVKTSLSLFPEETGVFDPEFDIWVTSVMFHTISGIEIAFLYYSFDEKAVYLIAIETQ